MPGRHHIGADFKPEEHAYFLRLGAELGFRSNAAWLRSVLLTLYEPTLALNELARYPHGHVRIYVAAGILALIRKGDAVKLILLSVLHEIKTLDGASLSDEEHAHLQEMIDALEAAVDQADS